MKPTSPRKERARCERIGGGELTNAQMTLRLQDWRGERREGGEAVKVWDKTILRPFENLEILWKRRARFSPIHRTTSDRNG